MNERILVYGATGYTGKLIAAEAARRGLDVVLAGRSPEKLAAVAEPLGLETRAFPLTSPTLLREALADVACVLHVAGPFSETSAPMVEACLATKTHYLDVTGEIDVFEAIARRGDEAKAAGVLLLPGVGFDVVPSDCLAAHVGSRLTDARELRIAIAGLGGGVSRGTAKTMVEAMGDGLRVRRGGVILRRPAGSLERHFDFGAGPARGIGMPWGDVSTAFHSTGIPNIEVYVILSGPIPTLLKASRLVSPLLRQPIMQRFLKARVDSLPEGPSEEERRSSRSLLLAEAEASGGRVARSLLETPNGYTFTCQAAVEIAVRTAHGEAPIGFQTPSSAFGADFVLALPDCERSDLD